MSALEVVSADAALGDPPSAVSIARVVTRSAAVLTACALVAAVALGSVGAVIVASIAGTALAVSWPRTRSALARWAARRQLARRRRVRQAQICSAHPWNRAELAELSARLAETEQRDPRAPEHYQLDEALDEYVTLAVACQRIARAAARVDCDAIERRLSSDRTPSLHRGVLERRRRRLAECDASVVRLRTRTAVIADYVRLVAERTAVGEAPSVGAPEAIARLERLEAAELELSR